MYMKSGGKQDTHKVYYSTPQKAPPLHLFNFDQDKGKTEGEAILKIVSVSVFECSAIVLRCALVITDRGDFIGSDAQSTSTATDDDKNLNSVNFQVVHLEKPFSRRTEPVPGDFAVHCGPHPVSECHSSFLRCSDQSQTTETCRFSGFRPSSPAVA